MHRRWDDVVDDFKHPKHIPTNFGLDFEDTVDTIENDIEWAKEVPPYARQIWQRLMLLKWIINLWVVGVPWCTVLFVIFVWNIYVNIFWNKWWAKGNLFLLGNTAYIIYQSLITLPLMFEIPPLLKLLKPFRILSLLTAVVYNILFLGSIFDFFYLSYEYRDLDPDQMLRWESHGITALFQSVFIFFNLVENFPIVIINLGIIAKEATLPFFQLITNAHAPTREDRIQLSLIDVEDASVFFFHFVDPPYIIRLLWIHFFGWDPRDMLIENLDDEEHYYAGELWQDYEDWRN